MSDAEQPASSGPKRHSTEPTLVIDREKLPPPSVRDVSELDLDPDHPETRELMLRAQHGSRDRETMEPCPICVDCKCCGGIGMVSPSRAAVFAEAVEALGDLAGPANDDEPPPEAA